MPGRFDGFEIPDETPASSPGGRGGRFEGLEIPDEGGSPAMASAMGAAKSMASPGEPASSAAPGPGARGTFAALSSLPFALGAGMMQPKEDDFSVNAGIRRSLARSAMAIPTAAIGGAKALDEGDLVGVAKNLGPLAVTAHPLGRLALGTYGMGSGAISGAGAVMGGAPPSDVAEAATDVGQNAMLAVSGLSSPPPQGPPLLARPGQQAPSSMPSLSSIASFARSPIKSTLGAAYRSATESAMPTSMPRSAAPPSMSPTFSPAGPEVGPEMPAASSEVGQRPWMSMLDPRQPRGTPLTSPRFQPPEVGPEMPAAQAIPPPLAQPPPAPSRQFYGTGPAPEGGFSGVGRGVPPDASPSGYRSLLTSIRPAEPVQPAPIADTSGKPLTSVKAAELRGILNRQTPEKIPPQKPGEPPPLAAQIPEKPVRPSLQEADHEAEIDFGVDAMLARSQGTGKPLDQPTNSLSQIARLLDKVQKGEMSREGLVRMEIARRRQNPGQSLDEGLRGMRIGRGASKPGSEPPLDMDQELWDAARRHGQAGR